MVDAEGKEHSAKSIATIGYVPHSTLVAFKLQRLRGKLNSLIESERLLRIDDGIYVRGILNSGWINGSMNYYRMATTSQPKLKTLKLYALCSLRLIH